MSSKIHLFFVCILINPVLVVAEEQKGHAYTDRDQVVFVRSTQAAFDRSSQPQQQ